MRSRARLPARCKHAAKKRGIRILKSLAHGRQICKQEGFPWIETLPQCPRSLRLYRRVVRCLKGEG